MSDKKEIASSQLQSGWDAAMKAVCSKPALKEVMDALDYYIVREGDGHASFTCPLHEDNNASGWIKWGYDDADPGKYTVRCYGCEGDEGEWFGDFVRWMKGDQPLRSWGSKQSTGSRRSRGSGRGTLVGSEHLAAYHYHDKQGETVACKHRWRNTYALDEHYFKHRRSFSWSPDYPISGSRAPLFNLPDVLRGVAEGDTIYVVEGEKDALTMKELGFIATTGPNGAGTPWTQDHLETLRDAEVIVIADNDGTGHDHARYLFCALQGIAKSVEVKVPETYKHKDVTEIHESGGDVLGSLKELPKFMEFPLHVDPLSLNTPALEPDTLADDENRFMLYPGEIHWLYGRPGTYKSMLALRATLLTNAVYLDFENGPAVIKERMHLMGAEQNRHYKFAFPETREDLQTMFNAYLETKPNLVVIDGFSGFAGLMGVDADNNAEVQRLFSEYLYPLKNAGIAVLMIDHLPKDASHDEFPIGAQCKKAQSGVTILLKQTEDTVYVYVTKDRHYKLASRCEESGSLKKYGWLHIVNADGVLRIQVKPVLIAEIEGKQLVSRDASLYQAIWNFVDANPGATKSAIEQGVQGKHSSKRKALDDLVDSGFIKREQVGPALTHSTLKPLSLDWYAKGESRREGEALTADWVSTATPQAKTSPGSKQYITPEVLRELTA